MGGGVWAGGVGKGVGWVCFFLVEIFFFLIKFFFLVVWFSFGSIWCFPFVSFAGAEALAAKLEQSIFQSSQ